MPKERLAITISKEVLEKLNTLSQEVGLSRSAMITYLIMEAAKENGRSKKGA